MQVLLFGFQRFPPLGTDGIGGFPRIVEESLTFCLGLARRFTHEAGTLLVKLRVLLLEFVMLFLGFGLFRVGVGEFRRDPLLARIDRVKDRLVKEAFHQPYQDEKVECLRCDGKPIDKHRSLPRGLGDHVVPEWIDENENQ